jgi:hypothetical protein
MILEIVDAGLPKGIFPEGCRCCFWIMNAYT